jgi:hypothetical protein
VEPTVRFEDRAVIRMLDKIREGDRSQAGRRDGEAVRERHLDDREPHRPRGQGVRAATRIRRAIVSTTADRTFVAHTRKLHPKVTNADLEQRFGTAIVVNRGAFKLTLYKKLKPAKTYSIAVGQIGLETPAGLYHIQNKAVNPAWNVPNSSWAGDSRARSVPGGAPTTRSRRAGWASSPAPASTARTRSARSARGLARLHPDADPGRDRALRRGVGRCACLHRVAAATRGCPTARARSSRASGSSASSARSCCSCSR